MSTHTLHVSTHTCFVSTPTLFFFCFGSVKQYVSTHKAICRLILSFFYFNIVLLQTWVSSQHIMKRMEDKQKVSFKDNGYYTLSSKNELLMMLEMKN